MVINYASNGVIKRLKMYLPMVTLTGVALSTDSRCPLATLRPSTTTEGRPRSFLSLNSFGTTPTYQ